jgi:hypothetical protein
VTDYSPEALEDLKEKMAHAAIKWVMYEEPTQWDGNAEDGFYGAGWEGRLPPVSGPTGTVQLKFFPPLMTAAAGIPPGARVTGDGYNEVGQGYYTYEVDPWTDIYEPWINRIDEAFKGWDTIPEPGEFSGPINSIRSAVTALTPLPTQEGGPDDGGDPEGEFETTYADVELETALGTMDAFIGADTAGADQGLLIYAFRHGYGPDRIRSIMGNQAQVAIVLGLVLLGEQKVWQGAQQDIMAIADKASESFRPGGGGGDIDLKVVKAFVDLLATFVPAPVKPVLATGSAALSLVDELMPEDTPGDTSVKLDGYTPDEVYNSMVDAIRKLEQRVFDQEYELAYTTLSGVLDYMYGHDGSQFHIHPDKGLDLDLAEAPRLTVHPEYLKRIGYQLVPGVAAYLGHAAEDAQSADKPDIWRRTNYIGLSPDGPYPRWSEVLGEFDAVTTGSGKELVEAGRLLAVGAGFVEDTDGDTATALKGVQDDLDRGSDEWTNEPPEYPYGYGYGGYGPH